MFDTAAIVLAAIALFAAFVNGALGYGFSSLTVPIALVFYANRILNPAIVVIEVFVNFYVLFMNLSGVTAVWKRVVPVGNLIRRKGWLLMRLRISLRVIS